MTRNLKVLGLALFAAFAMSAVVASAASAQTLSKLTSDGPAKLTGTDTVGQKSKLTGFVGQSIECHGHYDIGTVNETPYEFDTYNTSTITVTPTYSGCVASIGETKAPATVTTNSCDFVLHLGETVAAGEYAVTGDVSCEKAGDAIIVHAYSSESHATSICTVEVPGGQNGVEGGRAKTIEEGGVHKITLQGPFKGFTAKRTGILCGGAKETKEAELDIHAILSATNEGGTATHLTLTD